MMTKQKTNLKFMGKKSIIIFGENLLLITPGFSYVLELMYSVIARACI